MNTLLISLIHLLILVDVITEAAIGLSPCRYSGDTDPEGEKCHKDFVKVKKLPTACTGLFYEGITIDDNFEIAPTNKPTDDKRITMLLLENKYPVTLYYSRKHGIKGWFEAVDPLNTETEILKLKNYVSEHRIAGLVLKGIDYRFDFVEENEIPINYSEKISKYIKAIKGQIPSLSVGLYIEAKSLIDYSEKRNTSVGGCSTPADFTDWFSFEILNAAVDYYLFGFEDFNKCDSTFFNGGITPLVSPDPKNPKIYTLDRFSTALLGASIPKNKIYLEYLINPSLSEADKMDFSVCERSYKEYCKNDRKSWCADNQDTFYEKGKFAAKYAHGFVVRDIDLVDRDEDCKCDDKYITFHMVLSGFNGEEKKTCSKISGS